MTEYNSELGVVPEWELNSKIITKQEDATIIIQANTQGLRSLAKHLLRLADEKVPVGTHIHYDDYSALEKDSVELIFDKLDY